MTTTGTTAETGASAGLGCADPVGDGAGRRATAAGLRAVRASKRYLRGQREVAALAEVSVDIHPGELTFVLGPSGSGKSTLLHLFGALDHPSGGEIWLGGDELSRMSEDERTRARRERMGFVFQSFHLLDTLDALDNVMVSRFPRGIRPTDRDRARALLERTGLGPRLTHRPTELSGGEQQRVAIARALFPDPEVILADEPTGELDSATGREVLGILREAARLDQKTIVIVTHDAGLLAAGDRAIRLRDGRVVEDARVG